MFKEDIHIAIEKEEELRTFILKNWLLKYYKNESDIFQRAMGEIGAISNPENENTLTNIYSSLWGEE